MCDDDSVLSQSRAAPVTQVLDTWQFAELFAEQRGSYLEKELGLLRMRFVEKLTRYGR
jgi:hypothetical protein